MQPQSAHHDPGRGISPGGSSFRDAFSRARLEALDASGTEPASDASAAAAPPRKKRAKRPHHAAAAATAAHVFAYRIEKRRGSRKQQQAAWNALGQEGWELVALSPKHATFKRAGIRH